MNKALIALLVVAAVLLMGMCMCTGFSMGQTPTATETALEPVVAAEPTSIPMAPKSNTMSEQEYIDWMLGWLPRLSDTLDYGVKTEDYSEALKRADAVCGELDGVTPPAIFSSSHGYTVKACDELHLARVDFDNGNISGAAGHMENSVEYLQKSMDALPGTSDFQA